MISISPKFIIVFSIFINTLKNFVIHVNDGITINVDASVKNNIYVKKIIFGILVHVVVKMGNI